MLSKRLFFVVTILAVGLPFVFSCKNTVEETTSSTQDFDVPDGKCAIFVCPPLSLNGAVPEGSGAQVLSSVRSAYPDTVDKALYAATLSYKVTSDDGEESTKYLTANGVSDKAILIFAGTSATTDAVIQKRFVFGAPTIQAEYTLTLYLTTGLDSTETINIEENQKSVVAKGSTSIELEAYQRYVSDEVSVTLDLFTENLDSSDVEKNNGNCKLFIKLDSSLDGCTMTAKMTRASDSKDFTLAQDTTTVSGYTILTFEETAENNCGLFTLDLAFTKDGTEVTTNYTQQDIAIMGGMITSAWYKNGQKITDTVSVTEGETTFSYNYLTVLKDVPTFLYVKGGDVQSSETQDGKIAYYTEENFGDNIPGASDTTGDGSMAKPYATIPKAIERIMKDGNENTEYTIYIDGTFKATTTDFSTYVIDSNGEEKLSVNSSYCSYIAIEPKTSLNKNGTLDSTVKAGRVIKIKGLGYLSASGNTGSSADVGASDLSYSRAVIDGNFINNLGGAQAKTIIFSLGSGATVTLENIAIKNAFGSSAGTGKVQHVIMNSGAKLTLKNCLLDGSNFVASGINSTSGGSLNLVNTTISNFGINGINGTESEVTLTKSTVSNNSASGIKVLDTNVTLDSCLITKNSTDSTNTTASDGGGIHFRNAMDSSGTTLKKLVIKDSQMAENGNTLKNGGALYISGGNVSLKGTTELKKNTALSGGGIFINPDLTGTLTDSSFGESCTFSGAEKQTITLDIAENVKIGGTSESDKGNSAVNSGSAIAVSGDTSSYNINVAINTYGTIDYNTVTATSDTNNTVGGAIYIGDDSNAGTYSCNRTLNIYGGSISNNSSSLGASALYVKKVYYGDSGTRTVNIKPATGKTVNINNNTGARAIYLYKSDNDKNYDNLNLVIGNELTGSPTNDEIKAEDNKINISNNPVGAIYAKNATVTMNHAILDSNGTADTSNYGSAFYLDTGADLYIKGGKIGNNKNRAVQVASNSNVYMSNGYMDNNDKAVYLEKDGKFFISGNAWIRKVSFRYLSGANYVTKETYKNMVFLNSGTCINVAGALSYMENPYCTLTSDDIDKLCAMHLDCTNLSVGDTVVTGSTDSTAGTYTLQSTDGSNFKYRFNSDFTASYDSNSSCIKIVSGS